MKIHKKIGLIIILICLLIAILSISLPVISFGSGTSSIAARTGVSKSVSVRSSGSGTSVVVTTTKPATPRPAVPGSGSSTPRPSTPVPSYQPNTPRPVTPTPTPTRGPDFDPIAHEHEFKAVTHIPAGCGTYGKAVLQCWCGATRYKTLDYEKPKQDHFWSPYSVEVPDCKSNKVGKIYYHCLYCGAEKVETAGYNHDFVYKGIVTLTYANSKRTYQAKEYECSRCHGKKWEKVD